MTVLNYILLSLLYFWGSSTALSFGIGYYTLYRPVITGLITGIIFNDIQLGILSGAVVNIVYIDFVSTGGSLKGDQCLSGILAALASIIFNLSPIQSLGLIYPFGFFGILIWKYRLNINSIFVRKFEEKVKLGKYPNILIYNLLLPQGLLFLMSSGVMIISIWSLFIFKEIIKFEYIQIFLNSFGLLLLAYSIINMFFNMKSKSNILVFIIVLFLVKVFNISSLLIVSFILMILLYLMFNRKKDSVKKYIIEQNNIKNSVLNKKDLLFSWFVWINTSHACYNYERLQGMAFAHSMKNIVNKIYKDENEKINIINSYTEFFNTEPNIGTSIHGYIISLEEKKHLNYENIDISYIKKSMMGIVAGLGDSLTQVVISPLFVSISLLFIFDKKYYESLIPIAVLSFVITYISYTGWMNGYYKGKESILERIKIIRKNKIKQFFPLIFSIIFGAVIGKFINFYDVNISENIRWISIISIILIFILFINNKRLKEKTHGRKNEKR